MKQNYNYNYNQNFNKKILFQNSSFVAPEAPKLLNAEFEI